MKAVALFFFSLLLSMGIASAMRMPFLDLPAELAMDVNKA